MIEEFKYNLVTLYYCAGADLVAGDMRGAEAGVEVGAGEREGGRRGAGAGAGAGAGGRGVEAAGAATRTFRSGSSLEILSSSCILLWPRSGRGALEAFVASCPLSEYVQTTRF